ncbi:MAG: hypothetical protein B6I36_07690 [Desulfobacteraceae bacterium 4572_35.1]|nr:MAG: hypothetical protein B6I36_07690 [Desulfobacteraceae bacterium 4572_35.1]
MSQQTNISAALVRTAQALNTVAGRVGTLASLNTTEKTNLVGALNEVRDLALASSGAGINDTVTATDSAWSSTKIVEQINAAVAAIINGAAGDSDTLSELATQITALAQADNGLLSFAAEQTLDAGEQLQGCTNLGIGDPTHDYTADVTSTLNSGL